MKVKVSKDRMKLVDAALGKIQCDLSIDNVQLVNVITGEIYPAGVDIIDGIIVRVRTNGEECNPPAKRKIDGSNNYLLPGFIDTHMHVESTMMIPENFGKAAVTWGTTTAVTDPHEIANVSGIPGVEFMFDSAEYSPLRIYTLAPSCVPAVPSVENAGAKFTNFEVSSLLQKKDVIGVAEVMDYLGVINNDERMRKIIHAGESADGFIQGHAPYVRGNDLCAYLCGGPVSDHETRVASELIEKLRLGMHVNIKSSSLSDTVQEFLQGVKNVPIHDYVSFCTDDVHAADLLTTGHINHIANECIKGGMNPIDVIRCGTINAARELHFEDLGAIAPSYVADLQLVKDLTFANKPLLVIVDGKPIEEIDDTVRTPKLNITIKIQQITSPDDFTIAAKPNAKYIVFSASRANMKPGQKILYESFPEVNGKVSIPDLDKYQFISVVNRHGHGTMTTVICSDFHLKHGCIASTISHDSHNMTVVFRDPKDAYIAAKELERIGGGMCFVENGEVKYSLPLPVAGLMSYLPAKELAPKIKNMDKWVAYACDGESSMLLAIAILALPVRPGVIITDMGIIRGETLQFVPQILEGE